jgi:hypothetical protein
VKLVEKVRSTGKTPVDPLPAPSRMRTVPPEGHALDGRKISVVSAEENSPSGRGSITKCSSTEPKSMGRLNVKAMNELAGTSCAPWPGETETTFGDA